MGILNDIPPNIAQGVEASLLLNLQAAMLRHDRFDAAATELATLLAGIASASRVAIGFAHKGSARILAVSHCASIDPLQELNQKLAGAMNEAMDQAASISFPQQSGQPRISFAHGELVRKHGGAVCTVPISHGGAIHGAVTFERTQGAPFVQAELEACESLVNALAPLLVLKNQGERSVLQHARDVAAILVRRFRASRKAIGAAILAGIVATLVFCLVPVGYEITAAVRLESAVQHALVAPDDGYIQAVTVRPGDAVRKGQVLAELSQQELELERGKLEGELGQHEGAYNTALAQYDRAMLVIHQAKVEQARARLELIDKQIDRAHIRAPFDGLVISGDLSQALGAPIQRGSLMMTVAPDQQFRLMVEVDERDIMDVAPGAKGRITLAALAGKEISFRATRIAPVAVTRDGRHFFVVEGKPDATDRLLRPGLEGVAKIEAHPRPLAEAMFSRLWTGLRVWLWSQGWWR